MGGIGDELGTFLTVNLNNDIVHPLQSGVQI